MPIARVQLPDGRIGRFEVPEGTTPEQAQSLIQAQLPALSQPAAPQLPESLRPRTAAPEGIPGARQEANWWQKARPFVAPTVEALGAGAGGLVGGAAGTVAGPVGTATGAVGGAGLGYGIAKELLELGDVYLGGKAPRQGAAQVVEPVRNILEGATFEAGGRVAGPLIQKGLGKVMDLRQIPKNKTARLARNALGADLDQAVNALRNAPPGTSVAEVTANIQNPAWQALIRDGLEKSPQGAQYLSKFATMSHDEGVNALSRLVGGATAAEARGTTEAAKEAARTVTSPMRESALTRANLGKEVARLEGLSAELGEQAAAKVQEVRRLMELGDLANASARLSLIKRDLPVGLTKYTYGGELAEKAFNEWSNKAAQASLDLGQGARFAEQAAGALRSVGIKPLEGEPLVRSLKAVSSNPEFAGNDVLLGSLRNVADDIAKWTNSGGIIDARALDAIRKNSVNAAIQQLRPGMDATSQRNLAAGVLSRVKPVIDDAIEAAGGVGYREYLKEHAKLSQKIAEKQLTGEALRLWKTDKNAFVRLVQNESPDVVEKILGPGKYNIAVELAEDTLGTLQSIANKRLNQLAASKQATDGEKALTTLLRESTPRFRLPSWLSFWGAAANKTISELEKAIGSKSMKVLAEAAQSPSRTANLLESLPAAERSKVLQLIGDPSKWSAPARATVTGGTAAAVNMLAPERNVENDFVR